MKILVSGGTGYVGRFIVEELIAAGHGVTVGGRSAPQAGFFSTPVRFVDLSLDPDRDQSTAFAGIDAFVHAAFDHLPGRYRGGEGSDPENFRRKNLDGSVALFHQAKAADVRRVVFLSSRAVYGMAPAGQVFTEEMQPRPDTLYGEVKLAAETALGDLMEPGFRGTSLRITGVYGPAGAGREDKWAPLFRGYLSGKPIEPRAATEVHGADVAAAVRLVLEAAEAPPILNVSDLLLDRRDLLAIVQGITGSPHPLPDRADAARVNIMATEKLQALGWRPGEKTLLRQTVAGLLARGP